jgi:hypothetical protein
VGRGLHRPARRRGWIEVRVSLRSVDGKRRRVKARVRSYAEAQAKLDELRNTYVVGRREKRSRRSPSTSRPGSSAAARREIGAQL